MVAAPESGERLSGELSLEFRGYLASKGCDAEHVTKAIQEVDHVVGRVMEEMDAVLSGEVQMPLTEDGARRLIKSYLELPKTLQLAEKEEEEKDVGGGVDPWKTFIEMIFGLEQRAQGEQEEEVSPV